LALDFFGDGRYSDFLGLPHSEVRILLRGWRARLLLLRLSAADRDAGEAGNGIEGIPFKMIDLNSNVFLGSFFKFSGPPSVMTP
jgi:hypothetical protein